MDAETSLIAEIGKLDRDPVAFCRFAFPWGQPGPLEHETSLREWQREALDAIGQHLRGDKRYTPLQMAVASGHGIGKSALIGMICNWAMSTCADCRVVVTANTGTQLDTKTWPEISKWFRMAINAHWWDVKATSIAVNEASHQKTWRIDAITWSENNTEAFAGLHNKGRRIVVIYDESSTIADKVWEVTQGALTDEDTEIIWLAFGNPTQNTGRFRECFGRFKHRWVQRHIDSRSVPGTNKELFDQWVKDWGEDSDFVRIRVKGEFPRQGSNQFISGAVVGLARKRDVGDQGKAYKILSVDVARFGDDQTVIGYRQGLQLVVLEKLRGLDTMQVGARVCWWIQKEQPRTCVVDGDGIGGGVADYVKFHMADWMKERRNTFRLEEFHGGNAPGDAFMYFNRRAESWGLMRDWLETGSIPDDPELDADLTGPQYFFSNKNQIQLERKDDMKSRGVASPDTADMLAMTFGVTVVAKTYDEELAERIEKTSDPMERHFMRLRETERRKKSYRPLHYWE